MSINVKKVKRVLLASSTQNKEPIKEFNAGDNTPAFRQNGYSLTFDAASSDYLQINKSYDNIALKDINTSIDFYTDFTDSGAVFAIGRSNSSQITIRVFTDNRIELVIRVNSAVEFANTYTSQTKGNYNVTFDSIGVLFNGIRAHTYLDPNEVLIFNVSSYKIVRLGCQGWYLGEFTSVTILGSKIFGEIFNLEESYGDTITGSDGTVGTINTSHASGQEYIDATIWNKKSFALECDRANSEYFILDVITPLTFLISEFTFKIDININSFDLGQIFAVGRLTGSGNGYIGLGVNVDGSLFYQVNQGTTLYANFNYDLGGAIGLYSIICDGSSLFINGLNVFTYTDNSILLTLDSVRNINLGKQSYDNARYINADYFGFTFNSEKFNLTEGLGNEVEGSSGTVGTIYTSHASGTERINYGVWLKGNDTDGWNPYT